MDFGLDQMKLIPTLTEKQRKRFWSQVSIAKRGCWEWTGYVLSNGYGQFKINYGNYKAHRVAYFLSLGAQPSGVIMHSCDNRRCCNPDHLIDGSPADNSADMVAKGRAARPQGEKHPMRKLTDQKVLSIYESADPYPVLAKRYGVSTSLICAIKRRRVWRHLLCL